MKKSWRPDNWEEIIKAIKPPHCTTNENDQEYWHFLDGVEAGADAMLQGVIEQLKQDKQEIKKQNIGEWQQGQLHEIDSLLSRLGDYSTFVGEEVNNALET